MFITSSTVCVTGANGFLASHVVRKLLERGYRIKATVRDPTDDTTTKHLKALPGAQERLELYRADLLKDGDFDDIIQDCSGVFHMASPVPFVGFRTQDNCVTPALKGTENVFSSILRATSVRRVVLTSSVATVFFNAEEHPPAYVYDEENWSSIDYMRQSENWYALGKTLAEQKAMEMARDGAFDLVTILPGMSFGEMLCPRINSSVENVLKYLTGRVKEVQAASYWVVDADDVAEAHVRAFERTEVSGRFLVASELVTESEICRHLRQLLPENQNIPTQESSSSRSRTAPKFTNAKTSSELGITFCPLKDTLGRTIESAQKLNLLS